MKSNSILINDEIIPIPRESIYSLHIKRILDLIMSSIALIILLPVFILVSILELIFHGRPILYASKRPGKNGQVFNIFKFRSMTNDKDETGQLLDEEFRLTRFGRLLRRTSLDELPELWSIFCWGYVVCWSQAASD